MKMKQEQRQYAYTIYFFLFVACLLVFLNIPLVHDAWAGQSYNNYSNFVEFCISRIKGYFTLNGRIMAQIMVGFFERNKLFLNIANSFVMVCMVFALLRIVNRQFNIIWILLCFFLLINVSTSIRTEVYFYANLIYTFPVLFFFFFIYFFENYMKDRNISGNRKRLLYILAILNAGWIEHSALGFVGILMVLFLTDYICNKKVDKNILYMVIICSAVFIVMMLSPGLRIQRTILVESQSIFKLIIKNMMCVIQNVMYSNLSLMFMLSLASLNIIIKNIKRSKFLIFAVAVEVVYFIIISYNIVVELMGINGVEFLIMRTVSGYAIWWDDTNYSILWLIMGVGYILLLLVPIWLSAKRQILLFCYGVGIFSVAPVVITPNFGARICYFSFMICILIAMILLSDSELLDNLNIKHAANIIIVIICLLEIDAYTIKVSNIVNVEKKRCEIIENVKCLQRNKEWDYNKTVILPLYSVEQLYLGASPSPIDDAIHNNAFLDYYGLDKNTLVIFSDSEDSLNVNVLNDKVSLSIDTDVKGSYIFYLMKDGQIIWNSEAVEEQNVFIDAPMENGCYSFKCGILDADGGYKEVVSARTIEI